MKVKSVINVKFTDGGTLTTIIAYATEFSNSIFEFCH